MRQERCWRVAARGEAGVWQLQEAPSGPIVLRLVGSSMNYKDALALTGRGRILRRFPLIPGIDLAGVVETSQDPDWPPGTAVFATGGGAGEERDGGFADLHACDGAVLLPIPAGWSATAMLALGTAGLTAARGVQTLQAADLPPGALVVTGATGGVGGFGLRLLSRLGYEVQAVTSKAADPRVVAGLRAAGAAAVIASDAFTSHRGTSLEAERFAGGLDCTGGEPLAALLRQTKSYGSVSICGVAASSALPVDQFPFVLRGVSLLGLSSVYLPMPKRQVAWDLLTSNFTPDELFAHTQLRPLSEAMQVAEAMLANRHQGRTILQTQA